MCSFTFPVMETFVTTNLMLYPSHPLLGQSPIPLGSVSPENALLSGMNSLAVEWWCWPPGVVTCFLSSSPTLSPACWRPRCPHHRARAPSQQQQPPCRAVFQLCLLWDIGYCSSASSQVPKRADISRALYTFAKDRDT